MKRIIEIPDEVVKAIQNGEDYRYDIHTVIAQSKPYDDSGDHISRSEIRKAIEELPNANPSYSHTCDVVERDEVFEIIDNAQAVEITEEQAINKLHETGWLIEHDKEMTTRPQGDCISREALKEAISKVVTEERKEDERWAAGLRYALTLIDNAQAISLPDEQIAWEQGYEAGLAQGKQDRQKGEWLFKHNSSDIWCSVCDENFDEIPQAFNFCPNCGAKMKGVVK